MLQTSQYQSASTKQKKLQKYGLFLVLFIVFLERATFYSTYQHLWTYIVDESTDNIVDYIPQIMPIWYGSSFFTPMIGALIADLYLGSFKTILLFLVIYFLGFAVLVAAIKISVIGLVIGMGSVAIGAGVKASLAAFGAMQLHYHTEKMKEVYWYLYYLFINLGAICGFQLLYWVDWVTKGFYAQFCILVITVLLFFGSQACYIRPIVDKKQFSRYMGMVWKSMNAPADVKNSAVDLLDRATLLVDKDGENIFEYSEVQDFRVFWRGLPLLILFVPYWVLYFQAISQFVTQSNYFDRNIVIFNETIVLSDWFTLSIESVSICIAIPIVLLIKPIFVRKRWSFGPRIRTTLGFFFAAISFLCAGLVETIRKYQFFTYGYRLQIYWQIPQYIIIGLSEVLAAITLLEILYNYAPRGMKTIVIAINYIIVAAGSYIGALIIALTGQYWLPVDLNYGKFDYYCFILAGAQILTTVIFLVVTRRYVIYESDYDVIEQEANISDIKKIIIESGLQFIQTKDLVLNPSNLLGHGTEGVVYKGTWNYTTDVAIKIICPDLPIEHWDQDMLDSWLTEIKIHDNCNHRNIVSFRGISLDDHNRILLITEYMKHGDLGKYIGKITDTHSIFKIALDIAAGMLYLHNRNPPVIHRDLKPNNILIKLNAHKNVEIVKITDFGAATLQMKHTVFMSGARGTIEYSAPEVRHQSFFNEKIDVYSYGVILWALIMKQQPNFGKVLPFEVEQMAFSQEEVMIPWLLDNFPDDENAVFQDLIIACISLDPNERPPFEEIVPQLQILREFS